MLPVLFEIGPLKVNSYGLLIAIGVILAIVIADKRAKMVGIEQEDFMYGLGICSVIGGFAGAKLLYWITILPEIIENPAILKDFSNGFVVFGGLIAGVLMAVLYCRIKKVDFWLAFDVAAAPIALAQTFGRIGCFMAGCCYGKVTNSILGVYFSHSVFAPSDVPVLPTQLYSAALNFINFIFLSILWKQKRLKKGAVGAMYIITYSVGRFLIEFLRGDLERGSVGVLSTSQFIAVFTGILGIVLFIRLLCGNEGEKK